MSRIAGPKSGPARSSHAHGLAGPSFESSSPHAVLGALQSFCGSTCSCVTSVRRCSCAAPALVRHAGEPHKPIEPQSAGAKRRPPKANCGAPRVALQRRRTLMCNNEAGGPGYDGSGRWPLPSPAKWSGANFLRPRRRPHCPGTGGAGSGASAGGAGAGDGEAGAGTSPPVPAGVEGGGASSAPGGGICGTGIGSTFLREG